MNGLAEPRTGNRLTTADALRGTRWLVGGYAILSVLTMIAVILLRDDTAMVNSAVWTRCIIVTATSLLTLLLTRRAAQGSRDAFKRLRIVSAAVVVAIAVIIAIPDPFPLWLKIEQGCCGLLLLGVVGLVNRASARAAFAR